VASKQRGQAVVEFGIIALLFTLLMFAVIDVGLLLNTWLSVSSGTRELARSASVGKKAAFLSDEATKMVIPSVRANGFAGGACCGASSAVHVTVEYFAGCVPGPACTTAVPKANILTNYPAPDWSATSCNGAGCHPVADDFVRITVVAQGAEVITPLVRPFFGCNDGSILHCYVQLSSTTTMRFEGAEF
jgi:TadE-like protein